MTIRRLERPFFTQPTLIIARALLGQILVKIEEGGDRLSGMIVETEAYIGTDDLACHARAGRTARNASMWGPPGHAYVYFTYGMHWMLNMVTERDDFAAAVLIRSLIPMEGLSIMRSRRAGRSDSTLTDGPAKLCQALGIHRDLDGLDLCLPSSPLFLQTGIEIEDNIATIGPRIGLNKVPEPWKSIPWRFRVLPEYFNQITKEERNQ